MARRRGRGEGSITQRADGRWHARVDLGWEDGKRRRKSFYGRTRQAVAEKLRKGQNQVDDGLPLPDERQTVAQFLQHWLTLKRRQLRPRAYASYEQVIADHIEPGIGKVALAKLTPQQLAAWFERHQQEHGASARTIGSRARSSALHSTRRSDGDRSDETSQHSSSRRSTVPAKSRRLNPTRPARSCKGIDGHRLEALITVGVALGLRIGEILGLRRRDVNLDKGTLSVVQALERSGGDRTARKKLNEERRAILRQLQSTVDRAQRRELRAALKDARAKLKPVRATLRFTEPKSQRSRRTITLPSVVTTALRQHLTNQKKERLRAGSDWKDSGLIFTTPIGTPLDTRNVHREFKSALAAASLPLVQISRPAAHGCDAATGPRGGRQNDHGNPRPQSDQPDAEHVLACRTSASA